MPELHPVVKKKETRQKGIFNLQKVYKNLEVEIKGLGYDFTEKEQSVRDLTRGKEVRVIFLGDREFDDFVKFHVKIDFLFEFLKRVKVNDKILDKGRAKTNISSWLELDYRNKFGKNWFTKFLYVVYKKHVIKRRIDDVYEKKLKDETDSLYEVIKDSLELYT